MTKPRPRRCESGKAGGPTVRVAIDAFLDSPNINRSPHTRRAYAGVLDRTAELIGAERELAGVENTDVGDALSELWGTARPATWNRNRAAVSSWLAWCTHKQKWAAPGLPASLERRLPA
ncbi:MAG: site-specific integrase, partial [Pseudonocardiaceae bacterium]